MMRISKPWTLFGLCGARGTLLLRGVTTVHRRGCGTLDKRAQPQKHFIRSRGLKAARSLLRGSEEEPSGLGNGQQDYGDVSPSCYINQTALRVLQSSICSLKEHKIPEPEASAFHLLSSALDLCWETGYRELMALWEEGLFLSSRNPLSNRTLTVDEAQVFAGLVRRRLDHEPIQYLVRQWDFLDYVVRIRPPLLCPRPETEELVLLAEKDIRSALLDASAKSDGPASDAPMTTIRILDVGCGTGCIGISLLERLTRKGSGMSIVQVEAIDVEPVAIDTSLENAQRILDDKRVLVKASNSGSCQSAPLEPPLSYYAACHASVLEYDSTDRFHYVVSNPPYVPWTDRDTLDANVLNFESPKALFGGADGMDVIRDLVKKLPGWCRADAVCWLEVDPSHPPLLKSWIEQPEPSLRGAVQFESAHRDSFGLERFVRLRVNPGGREVGE